jgi:hypothetical protein
MSFKKLIAKVKQAEDALEAKERLAAADWRQLKAAWKAAWTPGRIIIAGLVSGWVIGRTDPIRHVAKSGSWLQLFTVVSGLFSSGSAQAAASEAGKAAETAEDVAETTAQVAEALAPGVAAQTQRTASEPVEP